MNIQILYYFYLGLSARKTAKELEIDYKTVQSRFMQFRKAIADFCVREAQKLNGELELDETYFGGKRKGTRGRGESVFGSLTNQFGDRLNVRKKTAMQTHIVGGYSAVR